MPFIDYSWRTFRPAEGFYTSEVEEPRRLPVRTFLPTGYEPNYPYPLLVFFHGHGGSEEQILRLAPRLSRRNYICISLRGPQTLVSRDGRLRYSWGPEGQFESQVEDYVLQAVEHTRRNYHVHSERIYLAGVCEGACLAYRLGLLYPERFAGVISLDRLMPRQGRPLFRLPALSRLRACLGSAFPSSRPEAATARTGSANRG